MNQLQAFIVQFKTVTYQLLNTIPFIVFHKLWEGFFKQKAVLTISVLAAIVIPYTLYDAYTNISSDFLTQKQSFIGSESITKNINDLFDGSNKYIVLILLHMFNVYFSNKTIEKLSGHIIDISFKEMISSQVRNLKVIIRNWIREIIIGVGISIIIGILGPDWLEEVLKFLLGSYFVGYIFLDNYNAAFKISIKESSHMVYHHAGAAIGLGLVAKILFLLPWVGPILASFICGVAGTWYMHTSDMHQNASEAYAD
jgi:hypothetical protein